MKQSIIIEDNLSKRASSSINFSLESLQRFLDLFEIVRRRESVAISLHKFAQRTGIEEYPMKLGISVIHMSTIVIL